MTEFKKYKDKYGLCLDWETSGSDWGGDSSISYQGIAFGAVIFETETFDEVDSFYCEIKFDPTKYKWSEEAERIHGLSIEHLDNNGVSQKDAAVLFMNWYLKYFSAKDKCLFLGHNREFDIKFTEQLLKPLGIMFPISHTSLDSSGVSWILTGLHRSDDMFSFLQLPERQEHNALEDARMTVEACKRLRMIFKYALES